MITKKIEKLMLICSLAIPLLLASCNSNGNRQGSGTQDGAIKGNETQGNATQETKAQDVGTQDGGTSVVIKDCCMLKDGKMVIQKDGKITPMETAMTMENGTVCNTNGECTTKEGKKMMMQEGDCMEMSGKTFNEKVKVEPQKTNTMAYSCPMHPEITSDKPTKCSKCGMELVKK